MPLVEGSLNRRQQLWAIADPPHIIVGNPKSLQRLVDLGRLRLNAVSFLVLDEVDACLLNTETKEDLHLLLSRKLSNSYQGQEQKEQELSESLVYRNKAGKQRDLKMNNMQYRISRQTIMCSASIPQRQHFASICKQNGWTETLPELIHVSSKCLVPPQVKHEYVQIKEELKVSCLRYLLQKEMNDWKPASSDTFQAIVFIDNPSIANDIFNAANSIMKDSDHTVEYLNDDMNLDERANVISRFRDGRCSVLICTDIIERGIDIPNVSHVFQYNLPDTVEAYLHRTGRAGRLGYNHYYFH
jgi:superfamily II DNA/RNA helicase